MEWITFIVYGLLIAAILWVFQRRWKIFYRVLFISLLLSCLSIVVYITLEGTFLGPESWYNRSPFRELILFLLMIIGMSARYMHNAIEDRQEKIAKLLSEHGKVEEKPKLEFDIWDFSLPFFVSVITFGSLLSQIESEVLTINSTTLGFQTGFFWQTLLKKRMPTE